MQSIQDLIMSTAAENSFGFLAGTRQSGTLCWAGVGAARCEGRLILQYLR